MTKLYTKFFVNKKRNILCATVTYFLLLYIYMTIISTIIITIPLIVIGYINYLCVKKFSSLFRKLVLFFNSALNSTSSV